MKRNPISLITGAVLVLIFALMLFTFQVRQTEVAVVTTFGKYSRSETQPGFNWRLPWPIQKVYKFDNRIHNFERKFEQTTTGDAISILITVFAGWHITDPRLYLESLNGDALRAEQTLEPLVRDAKNGVIGQHRFSDLISTNRAELKFDDIEKEMLTALQSKVGAYGLEIKFLGIKQLGLPDSITSKVFDRMKQERQTQITWYQKEGEREAAAIRSEADIQAGKILADARAKAINIEGEADAAASDYYRVFQQNPELAKFLFKRNALEQSLKERTTLILDQQTAPFDMFSVPTSSVTPQQVAQPPPITSATNGQVHASNK